MNILSPLKSIISTEPDSITKQGLDVKIVDFRQGLTPGVDYFNSSLVALPNRDYLVVRRSKYDPNVRVGINDLVAFSMDKDLPMVGTVLNCIKHDADEHFEDSRCVYHDGKIWVGACNFRWFGDKWTGAHQVLLEFSDKWVCVKRHDPVYGNNLEHCSAKKGHEKNWLWFWHNNYLHMVYRAEPHTVVVFDGNLKAIAEYTSDWKSNWEHGEIRGGTPPVMADDGLYWTFAHSSVPWRSGKRRYYMLAYAFEPKAPFKVVAMTGKPMLIGSQYDRWHPSKPCVVFPCGSVYRNGTWLITGGVNDFDTFYCRLPHSSLLGLVRSV